MQTLTILFYDHGIPSKEFEKVICDKFHLVLLDFRIEFRNQVWLKDELTNEIELYLKSGQLVPSSVCEKLIVNNIKNVAKQNVLLSNYPRTLEQYLGLEKQLQMLGVGINSFWYVRQREANSYKANVFNTLKVTTRIDDYALEFKEKWEHEFETRRNNINSIIKASNCIKLHVVDMDYASELSEEYVVAKIGDSED